MLEVSHPQSPQIPPQVKNHSHKSHKSQEETTMEEKETVKKSKALKKSVDSKDIKHNEYRDTLFNKDQKQHSMNTIRSNKHQLGSYKIWCGISGLWR